MSQHTIFSRYISQSLDLPSIRKSVINTSPTDLVNRLTLALPNRSLGVPDLKLITTLLRQSYIINDATFAIAYSRSTNHRSNYSQLATVLQIVLESSPPKTIHNAFVSFTNNIYIPNESRPTTESRLLHTLSILGCLHDHRPTETVRKTHCVQCHNDYFDAENRPGSCWAIIGSRPADPRALRHSSGAHSDTLVFLSNSVTPLLIQLRAACPICA